VSEPAKDDKALIDQIMAESEEIESPCRPRQFRVLQRIATNPDNHFVVGFGAGSVPGLAGNCALAGILEDLDLRSVIREVWGVSAGAAIGGTWAAGATCRELLDLLDSLNRDGVVDVAKAQLLFKGLPRFLLKGKLPDGLVQGLHFRQAIGQALKVEDFEDCEIPFRAIACTDDGRTRKVVFHDGPILPAIQASMCVPGVFFPVHDWRGEPYGYMDGAVVEKTPLISVIEEHRRSSRATNLVVLCTHYAADARIRKPVGFLKRILSVMHHLEDRNWDYQLLQAQQEPSVKYLVLNPRMEVGGMLDFGLARFHYLWARKYFKEQLSNARLAGRFDAR